MNTVNWGNLVERGRAKAHGIPWNDEEMVALQAGVPAEHVREGILTLEESQKASGKEKDIETETGEKPISRMNKEELVAKAQSLGLEVTPEATIASLREVINAALEEQKDNDEE